MEKTPILPPFKRLCVTIGNLPSSYVDSMSYYECLMWLCKYLKDTVVPTVNENAEAVNELINWFNTLDVQDEIDHKLDEMAVSGELEEIISVYLNSKAIFGFNTVADMKESTNLIEGSYAKTLGYHSINDGGSATYLIKKVTTSDVVNEMDKIAISEELYAQLVINNTELIVDQLGAYGDGTHDDTDVIQYAIDYTKTNRLVVKLLNKVYITSEPLTLYECTKIIGQYVNDEYNKNATIKNTTTDMVILENSTVGIHLENILFYGDETQNIYFNSQNTVAFEWCEFYNVSFRNYQNVFNSAMLGCRLNNIFINHVKSIGTLTGSDNTWEDVFAGSDLGTESDNLLTLSGYALSRFRNVYFTGKTSNENGVNNIINFTGGYCSNIDFDGCYFDFSNGSALNIIGQGNDFPKSGCTGISFNTCLFRGNCCSETTKHVININYAKNISFNNCSFKDTDWFTVNADSKLFNILQYAFGVSLNNNYYESGTISFVESGYQNNVQLNEPAYSKYNKLGYQYNAGCHIFTQLGSNKIIQLIDYQATTDGNGIATIPFGRTYTNNPIVLPVTYANPDYLLGVSDISTSQCKIQVRNYGSSGALVTNTSVKIKLLVATLSGNEPL